MTRPKTKAFSPLTTLKEPLGEAGEVAKVVNEDAFPDLNEGEHGYITLSKVKLYEEQDPEEYETCIYTEKSGDTLSGLIRGVEGSIQEWEAGDWCASNFNADVIEKTWDRIEDIETDIDENYATEGYVDGEISGLDNQKLDKDGDVLKSYAETVKDSSSSTIDVNDGSVHVRSIDSSTSFSFTSPASGTAHSFTLVLHGSGNSVTWPGSVDWPEEDPPEMDGTSVLNFFTVDGGSTWYGFLAGTEMN